MLRVCEKLREVDAKTKRLGLARTETDFHHVLLDAMANMDRAVEVEALKSLGDVILEKAQLHKDVGRFGRAMILYRTALLRCEDADIRESLKYRSSYAAEQSPIRVRLGKDRATTSITDDAPHTIDSEMSSPAKVAAKFLHLDRRLIFSCNDNDSVLVEYTKLMLEGIVNENSLLETEAIKSLGDVYLKRGTGTRDRTCLTKATALYNTALVRSEGVQDREALVHRLLYTARIRQDMRKIGNKSKGPKLTGQGQPRMPRAQFSTSLYNHPIDDNSVTPNDFIANQTPRRSAADYRSYQKHLTLGNRALAKGKLNLAEREFASALKLIHDRNKPDRRREAECLCRLGDVYVRRGKSTREGRTFTQAAALYNATLARANEMKPEVTKSLQDTEKWFLQYTANVVSKPSPCDSVMHHQKRLVDMCARVKLQLEAIDQQHNPYQYDEDNPAMITVEAERAEAVKALCKSIAKDRQQLIHDLVDECIGTLGPPPCKYAFIGLGSQATELVTPYSDLEFALLIEDGKDNDDTRRYFLNLTHYLHLKVINLGETILPAMAIPSLNDFQSEDPEKNWFFDSVTPRGFAFDGFMPWASKTPFGRDQTKTKPPVSLIQTPANLVKFQELVVSLSEGYHLSDILRRVVFLAGEEAMVDEYITRLMDKEIATGNLMSNLQSRLSIKQILSENMEQIFNHEPTGQLLNVKNDIYRFPGTAIQLLAVCCQITLASTWDVIDTLKKTGRIPEEEATHLTILTSISAELRLRTYMANGGQRDSLSPLSEMRYQLQTRDVSDSILKSVFYIRDTVVLFRYFCRAIPLKKCILDVVNDCLQAPYRCILRTTIFDTSNECRGRIAKNLFLLDKSIRHLEAALEVAGCNDIKQSEILYELGNVYSENGDITKAIHCFEKSLLIHKRIHGDNTAHPNIASTLERLGMECSNQGDWMKAISYCEQSLKMNKIIYGENVAHVNIGASLNNLGLVWGNVGDQVKAIGYYEQALKMREKIDGKDTANLDIASLLYNLGSSWSKLSYHKKGIHYLELSLAMMKTIYGENTAHPAISKDLHALGNCWSGLDNHEKARIYYEQSLMMDKTIYGENTAHADIAKSLHNLGLSWSELGDDVKAISYLQQSLNMRRTLYAYGDRTTHLDIAGTLHNLGISFCQLWDPKKAIDYFQESLAIRETFSGDSKVQRDIAASLHCLGAVWSTLGDQKKAISYFEKSLAIKRMVYRDNPECEEICSTLFHLWGCWDTLGDETKARSYFEQCPLQYRLKKAKII